MAVLAPRKKALEARRDELLLELEELDAQRAAAALDDPKRLAALDAQRERILVELDHISLADEETARRQVEEEERRAAEARKALLNNLEKALKARAEVVEQILKEAEKAGDLLVRFDDLETDGLATARKLGVRYLSVGASLAASVSSRLRLLGLHPWVSPSQAEEVDRHLRVLAAFRPDDDGEQGD